ncbi:hypothetical protein PIROE2DRAFT_2931 [Piromyces sp. E2]|nr:hypothetical protein PIROE2DRAFT_2931 [Piromyces sp. E2]|eukprot:OUM69225.1 hypothetical protein PIROE2DRAFT_2931 [Piromyces sp. E2]
MDLRIKDENGKKVLDYINVMSKKTTLVGISLITSFIYDLSAILVLKRNIFNNKNIITKNSFLEKFKHISEYRLYFSMIATSILIIFYSLRIANMLFFHSPVDLFNSYGLYLFIRNCNCYIMYIDQILIRYYYNKENSTNYRKTLNHIFLTNNNNSIKRNNSGYYFNNIKILNHGNEKNSQ